MAYHAGTAFLQVVPSFRGIEKEISKNLQGIGRQFGKALDESLPEGFTKAALKAARAAGPAGQTAGDGFGGAFAAVLRRRVEAALTALPAVEITADSSDAQRAVASVREQLAKLRDARIGVDLDELHAMGQLLQLEAALKRVTEGNHSVELNADTDRARVELRDFFEDVKTEAQRAADAAAKAAAEAAQKAAAEARKAAQRAAELQQADARKAAQAAAVQAARDAEAAARQAAAVFARTFAGQVQTAIGNTLARLPEVHIDADSSDAQIAIAAIRAQLQELDGKRIGVDVDEAFALASLRHVREQLDELSRTDATAGFRFDAAAGAAELALIDTMLERLDGRDIDVDLDVDTGRAMASLIGLDDAVRVNLGRLGLLVATGASLGTAIVPAAAAAASAVGFIGTSALASVAGLSVLALGFGGISEAVQAMGKATDAASTSTASLSRANLQAASAADAVISAERSLANTRASNADATVRAAQQVADAQRALG
ncbi:MAG TPA: hypothetical protein VF606_04540, partial [Geminicoccaceae bacterium]